MVKHIFIVKDSMMYKYDKRFIIEIYNYWKVTELQTRTGSDIKEVPPSILAQNKWIKSLLLKQRWKSMKIMEVNNANESDCMKEIEKQSNPKVMNL